MKGMTSAINVQVDLNDKKEATDILNELGLNMSTFINMCIKQVIKRKAVPFEVSIPNEATVIAMNNVDNNKNMSKTFNSVKELMEDLNAED